MIDCNKYERDKVENSFKAPFEELDGKTGRRKVDEYWTAGEMATVHENFIRLTQDRQSRRGWVFNIKQISDGNNWAAIIRFRISGKSKTLYGDGIAIWFEENNEKRFKPGMIMGHTDEYIGFGILFDTFENTESGHKHKDISLLLSNDINKPVTLDHDRPGCQSSFRYWQGRDDFNVNSESKAKIIYQNNILTLLIDPLGNDSWTECFKYNLDEYDGINNQEEEEEEEEEENNRRGKRNKNSKNKNNNTRMPNGWTRNAHFSVSSSTGALSDNHDVIEFMVGRPDEIDKFMEQHKVEKATPSVVVNVQDEHLSPQKIGIHVNDLAYEVKYVDEKLKDLHHKMEHQLEDVKIEINKMLTTLQSQEAKLEERVKLIEVKQENTVWRQIDLQLRDLEMQMQSNLDNRLKTIENQLSHGIQSIEEKGSSWMMPVLLISCIVVAGLVYLSMKMKKISARDKIF